MISGFLEATAALAIAIGSAIYAVGGVNANNKRNEKAIEDLKEALVQSQTDMKELIAGYQEDMKATIEKYQEDMKDLIDEEKSNSKESLSREVAHIRETLSININEIRDDIRRLEQSQNENARLREDLSLLKQSLRAIHHRLDLDIPSNLKREDED